MLNGTYSQKALSDSMDVGFMVETLVHDHLCGLAFRSTGWRCDYWMIKNGFEIDYVMARAKNKTVPIEVKYQNELKPGDAAVLP